MSLPLIHTNKVQTMKIITSIIFIFMAFSATLMPACFGIESPKTDFSLKTAQKDIQFTAFKTTAKVGVKGWFKKIDILTGGQGSTIREAVHQTSFSIPVSSLFTNEASRDLKIKTFFFGAMEDTSLLSGQLIIKDETSGILTIQMNDVSNDLPFTYTIDKNSFRLNATMNIDLWFVQSALSSLNKVCRDLHKGSDGISRTWPEVDLQASILFQ
jgi:hypothetical protein